MADNDPYGATQNVPGDPDESSVDAVPASLDVESSERPQRIGRYRIERVLGKGGFGLVYLAHDEQLDRPVAVKVPHAKLISQPEDAEVYLTEARTVANLDHPHIVPVYDVGSSEDCACYVVTKYVEGSDLATRIKKNRLKYRDAAELVATVAEALHYAHKQGLVHRDVKPGNILIGKDGKFYVVDFGLALREENIGKGPKYAGTPAYMSPEQARGEGHRVDGRSDIFSLGVVFYELLVGRRPFRGETQAELFEQVTSYEPRPLRQYDDHIPKELERICHKAMAKRASERYSTAKDLAEDLRHFLAEQTVIQSGTSPGGIASVVAETHASTPASTSAGSVAGSIASIGWGSSSDSQPVKIVPKGLRSFDAHDADFFLELLPGPRDREGLPDSLRFWKTRIEETDPDNTFSVGLIYGPSGCGKSSLVKAGLVPRLSEDVIAVYIEATPDETETRLLHGLRKRCPALEDNLSLKETLAALRRGQGIPVGKKVLIVLDQFEQWLHAKAEEENTDLVQALRQCDGGRVQCIVMVRDDFWLAVSRFLRELEVRLVEGENSALADLFDLDHARKVLAAFGRAFGKLPENTSETSKEQKDFLKQSVVGLAEEGKVICVRLALFAEMMKGKAWTAATLKKVGGTKGIGVAFLEETFSSSTAPPEHRYRQKAARAVLKALLPESGTDIKGQMKSRDELLEASGYARHPKDFDDLIRILDSEIRLITPTDPEGIESEDDSVSRAEAGQKYYQLTHDYLVHSLREWLNRKQRATRKGRAELRLAERSALWNAKPQNRHLPSWWENLNVRLFTDKQQWTQPQQKMMGKARRVHGLRSLTVVMLLTAVAFIGLSIRNSVIQTKNVTRAEGLVESLLNAEITQVTAVVSDMQDVREWADPLLKSKIAEAEDGSAEKLHLSLALLPEDESQIDYLKRQLPVCTLDQFPVVRDSLMPHKDKITDALWQLVQDDQQDPAQRFQAAAALAEYAPGDERWNEVAPFVAQHLTSAVFSVNIGQWLKHFRSAGHRLTGPLVGIHAERSNSEKQREAAALALADYLEDKPEKLVDVVLVADEFAESSPLIDALRPQSAIVKERLIGVMQAPMPEKPSVEQRDAHWKRQSMAAVTLAHLGHGEDVWSLLEFTPDPSLRSFIISYLGKLQANHNTLAARLQTEKDVSIRMALIQSLGGLNSALISPADRGRITKQLRSLFVSDPDSGVHSSASWMLRQWGETLPELPAGQPVLTEEHKQRMAKLAAEIADIKQRLADYKQDELPVRQAAWERKLREHPPELPASLTEGLVAHYPLDETEGTETANAVAEQPGGTYQGPGQPEWVPGIVGGALRLDGKGGYFNCGDAFNPERTDAFSYGCWFSINRNRRVSHFFLSKFDSALLRGLILYSVPSSSALVAIIASDNIIIASDNRSRNTLYVRGKASMPFERWHHAFVTYDGSSTSAGVTIYLNGRFVQKSFVNDSLSESIQTSTPLQIGRQGDSNSTFGGRIDDMRFYNRRLSDEDVKQLYETGLRTLAGVASENRSEEQQALLTEFYRSQDQPLQRLDNQLAATEAALLEAQWKDVRRWYVNSQAQTMVVIPNPSDFGDRRINHSFAISNHEVTVAEFLRFQDTYRVDRGLSPTDDCPLNPVNWYSAAEYCNWLSQQEGVPDDQWVYEPNDNDQYAEGMKVRENHLELMGYRLPTVEEWQYACRTGTTGTYGYGEPVSLLRSYAYYILSASKGTHAVGTLLPNQAGLFDMHGNVSEWCQTQRSGPLSPVRSSIERAKCGGSFYWRAHNVRSSSVSYGRPDRRSSGDGFRVCRTYNLSP